MSLLWPNVQELDEVEDRQEIIRRGRRARELFQDPLLIEIFERTEQEIVREWYDATKPEGREAAWAKMHALQMVKLELETVMHQGQYAEEAATTSE